jgi:RHS repeat-associated protein
MTTTKSYDYVNRLTGISSTSAVAAVSFAYAYNSANQRTRVDEADGSYWLYEYDSLGQVTSAKRYASGGYIMPGQQHEYTYDDIGNRKTAKSGGNQYGTSLRESTYEVNALNQYTNRTVPGYLEVQGSAHASATVTVNNESTTRQGAYYRKELTVNNAPSAVWQSITNVAVLAGAGTNGTDIVTTKTGNALVPKTPEAFTYDADGNMTSDGRFTYLWDAENRLLQVESLTNAPTGAKVKVTWTYDARSRRIQQQSYTEQSGTLVLTSNLKFLADGWRHIAELDATNNAPLKTYAWGLDLSGSLDGAGGVGGLLFSQLSTPQLSTHFYSYDGNGNVRALFSANDGTLTAQYDYDAFGNILRATGPAALANPFRFSTKRTDDLTSLVLYEYRAYVPWLGRWSNRDPIAEGDGVSIYALLRNAPLAKVDFLGLQEVPTLISPGSNPGLIVVNPGLVTNPAPYFGTNLTASGSRQCGGIMGGNNPVAVPAGGVPPPTPCQLGVTQPLQLGVPTRVDCPCTGSQTVPCWTWRVCESAPPGSWTPIGGAGVGQPIIIATRWVYYSHCRCPECNL